MRNICLVLILFLAGFSVEAQKYVPFPTLKDSAVWRGIAVGSQVIGRLEFKKIWADASFYIDHDTIIKGKTYHVLLNKTWVIDANRKAERLPNYEDVLYREENKIIYCYNWEDENEYKFYDFNLKQGDSLYAGMDEFGFSIINSIDSIKLNDNLFHKRFNTSYYCCKKDNPEFVYNDEIIEGIGSTKNFLFFMFPYSSVYSFNNTDLGCFTMKEKSIFKKDSTSFCGKVDKPNYNIVGLNEKDKHGNIFNIYPNPTSGQFTIQTKSIFSDSYICVRDVLGRIVLQEKLQFSNQTINIANQPKGLYFIELRNGNRKAVQKLILQ